MKRTLAAVALAGAALLALSPATASAASPDHRDGPAACTPTLGPGQHTITLTSSGIVRTVVVYIPENTTTERGHVPLVLTLHGSQSTALEQLDRSQLEATADKDGFIVAAPQGAIVAGVGFSWFVPGVNVGTNPNDEQFLIDVIDNLSTTACADVRRVYATGYSGGGRMLSAFACDHSDRLAALIPVAGLRAGVPMKDADGAWVPNTATCPVANPVPVLTFGGTADPVNPFLGGGLPYWGYGTMVAVQTWASYNGCRPDAVNEQVTTNVTKVSYKGCKANADVVAYVVAGGGHTWPGSTASWPSALGVVTQEICANDLMWEFSRTRVSRPA